MEEIILTKLTEAIKKINEDKTLLKDRIEKLNKDYEDTIKSISLNSDDLKSFKASHDSQIDLLSKQLNETMFKSETLIKDEISKMDVKGLFANDVNSFLNAIPIPKDGKNADEVDYKTIYEKIEKRINEIPIPKPESVNYEAINQTIKKEVSKIPTPKDGMDGVDGVGIEKIEDKKDDIVIKLTNKKEFKIKKPKSDMIFAGGGSSNSGGFDVNSVIEITEILNTDFILVMKDGKISKINIDNFVTNIFGFDGAIVNGVTYNGVQITYNGQPVTYNN
jgi:hypothetical protein